MVQLRRLTPSNKISVLPLATGLSHESNLNRAGRILLLFFKQLKYQIIKNSLINLSVSVIFEHPF